MADLLEAMTERFLVEAGVGRGMRVLDVGCGRGDVSYLAARLVGEGGTVVGVDRDPASIGVARGRASGQSKISFVEADLASFEPADAPFDAVVARRVLMYQPNALEAVRRMARWVRRGGLVFFQEVDSTMTPASVEPLPLRVQVHEWIWRTVEREGADVHMGFHLAPTLVAAGLLDVNVRAEAVVETPSAPRPLAALLRLMLPRAERHGVTSAAEIDLDTLDARLEVERRPAQRIDEAGAAPAEQWLEPFRTEGRGAWPAFLGERFR